jgi:hypothetical protein
MNFRLHFQSLAISAIVFAFEDTSVFEVPYPVNKFLLKNEN